MKSPSKREGSSGAGHSRRAVKHAEENARFNHRKITFNPSQFHKIAHLKYSYDSFVESRMIPDVRSSAVVSPALRHSVETLSMQSPSSNVSTMRPVPAKNGSAWDDRDDCSAFPCAQRMCGRKSAFAITVAISREEAIRWFGGTSAGWILQ